MPIKKTTPENEPHGKKEHKAREAVDEALEEGRKDTIFGGDKEKGKK